MLNGFYRYSLDWSISNIRGIWLVFIISEFYINSLFNTSSVDLDQMPRSVASDLGLNCLPKSLLWDPRHKWVKTLSYLS